MELFDMVKAAPPPQRIGLAERKSSTPSPIPPDSPPEAIEPEVDLQIGGTGAKEAKEDEADLKKDIEPPSKAPKTGKKSKANEDDGQEEDKSDEEPETVKQKKVPRKRSPADDDDEESTVSPTKKAKGEGEGVSLTEDNDDEDDEDSCSFNPIPTKTKAQQKMFSDSDSAASVNFDKECHVRVRRLTIKEITSAARSVSTITVITKKRGRPRRSDQGDGATTATTTTTTTTTQKKNRTPSPLKRQKSPKEQTPKIHIKVPLLQNGSKKRPLQSLSRTHTPPPSSLPKKVKLQSKWKSPSSTTSQDLIDTFGSRFFGCVVKVKRTQLPAQSPPRTYGGTASSFLGGGAKKGRPRKSNLSVSFSEAVEILGSNESNSRRATLGSGHMPSPKTPKPTRLQRVDDRGNVLEDIALSSTSLFAAPSSAPPLGNRNRRSCNGSRLKRPMQRLPLADLASLRIDDDSKTGEDEDAEYIVPNELPGVQRSGTPPAKKKKISFTTTVSDDDEDEKPVVKRSKDSAKKDSTTKKLKDKKLDKKKDHDKEKSQHKSKESSKKDEKDSKSQEKVEEVIDLDDKEEENPDAEVSGKEDDKLETINEEKNAKESSKDSSKDSENLNTSQALSESQMPVLEVSQDVAEDAQSGKEDELEEQVDNTKHDKDAHKEAEDKDDKQFNDLARSDNDALEALTPVDDIRDLETPTSRPSTPVKEEDCQGAGERIASPDSDCSFKSASNEKVPSGDASSVVEALEATLGEAPSGVDAIIPTDLIDPPTDEPSVVNGSESTDANSSAAAAAAAISSQFYSSIEPMPTLDDEVLDDLVEPDFQLNSSRHAISRGALDDIMTALES
ncbi:LOW QUALITY PROTEIN: uncharacterized protein Dana_GF22498 [Drosophila ananassae]|uniref:Uncharacterized protein n=1 Tax=Drosophila ananassae TaxID=7217 RepID=B3MWI8_DROAN|nr:LOW QUALITY PROTEIN: uncharacterized protein Dana_GF22498 [Drosophila ananassae]